ncbi:MAG TPA: fluoride efflux transporter CrcB [Chloroflexota bacterium]|nr:fluoride efflux transporter CrcB [Chloroflexota bacterium]
MTAQILGATFLGGGTGAACRYGIGRLVGARYGGEFPLGTFLINVTGCFALGLLASLLARSHQDVALPTALLATGFLGGYTTFSTFALEGVVLYGDGSELQALLSLVATVAIGLCAAAAGAAVASML